MRIQAIKTDIFEEGQDLFECIKKNLKKIPENSVLVITSKIVALSERRVVHSTDPKTKEAWIQKESKWTLKTKHVFLSYKDGMFMPNSGIDESNASGKLILLPKDSWKSAAIVRKKLIKHYKVKNLGVIISDSRTLPLRKGVTGIALGYAGFKGLRDYRGKPDLFGRKFVYSQSNVADSLSAAAVFLMGEGSESCPLALIQSAPVQFTSKKINTRELVIDLKDDMYRPLFIGLKK